MSQITQEHFNRIPLWALPTLMVIKCYTVPVKSRIIGTANLNGEKNPETVGLPVIEHHDGTIGLLDVRGFLWPLGCNQRASRDFGPRETWDFWPLNDEDRAYFEVPKAGNVPWSIKKLIES